MSQGFGDSIEISSCLVNSQQDKVKKAFLLVILEKLSVLYCNVGGLTNITEMDEVNLLLVDLGFQNIAPDILNSVTP